MLAPADPTNIDKVLDDINQEKYDLVAVGRALLADHEWAIKMKKGDLKTLHLIPRKH